MLYHFEKGWCSKDFGAWIHFINQCCTTTYSRPHIVTTTVEEYSATVMTINGRKSVPMSLLWHILKIFSTTLFLCGFQIIQAWQRTPFPNALARNKAQRGVTFFSKPEPFYLKWLSGWCVTTCYGCGNKIWAGIHDPVPPDPYNVVTTRKQICAYTPRGSVGLRFSVKP